jgi:hypothetical protein
MSFKKALGPTLGNGAVDALDRPVHYACRGAEALARLALAEADLRDFRFRE